MNRALPFVSLAISLLSLVGVAYLAYQQRVATPARLKACHEIAVGFERGRHGPVDDLTVTDQDVAAYLKNVLSCFTDQSAFGI